VLDVCASDQCTADLPMRALQVASLMRQPLGCTLRFGKALVDM
jgi:hypothetical protein